jgi:hypothetical protein
MNLLMQKKKAELPFFEGSPAAIMIMDFGNFTRDTGATRAGGKGLPQFRIRFRKSLTRSAAERAQCFPA